MKTHTIDGWLGWNIYTQDALRAMFASLANVYFKQAARAKVAVCAVL